VTQTTLEAMTIQTSQIDRRRFLGGVAGVVGLAALAQTPIGPAEATPAIRGGHYPFTLGVASGDPTSSTIILWTRLVPRLFEPGGGMPSQRIPVQWQVAADPGFHRIIRHGSTWAMPSLAHSVHVVVKGLEPGREWYYRFKYRGDVSAVGRTKTAPQFTGPNSTLTVAIASCQAWDHGYYPAYRHMANEDLDLVLHLGDYVYEYGIAENGGYRNTPIPDILLDAPIELPRWRMQYELYKSDPDLQRVHQRFPWAITWDDHEVANDYANHQTQFDPDYSDVRAAAYQAWYEHQPVRIGWGSTLDSPRIYRRLTWGQLAEFNLVDGRQYRDVPPCGWGEAQACEAAYDPEISMLGRTQERWLYRGLKQSNARWDVLGSNVMLSRLDHDGAAGDLLWHDAWDGFPAARNRLTRAWQRAKSRNPVVLTGDWHSTFVNDIRRNFDRPDSPVVATEFVGTSITTNGDAEVYGPYYGPMIQFNPHIQFFDGDRRGYVLCRFNNSRLRTDLQMVRTVSTPEAERYTYASFIVNDGEPGAVQIAGPPGGPDYRARQQPASIVRS
jgi:alkaline phosphatase D